MSSSSEEHISAALKRLERLTCRLCNSVFPTRNALFEHIPTHAMDKPSVSQTPQPIERLTCRLCDTVFPTRDALFAHIPIHAMDKPSGNRKPQPVERLTCRVCGMVFPTRNALFQHIPIHEQGDAKSDTPPVVAPPPVQPVQEPAPLASPFAERNKNADLTREPGAVDFYPIVASPVPFHPASPPRTYRGGQAPSSTYRHTPYVRPSASRYSLKHPSKAVSIGDVRQSNLARRRARRQAPLPEVPMDWEPTYAEVTIRAETDDFEKFGRMKNAPFKLPRPQPKKHNKKTSRSAH